MAQQNTRTALAKAVESDVTVAQALALIPGMEEEQQAVQAMVVACVEGGIFPPDCPPMIAVATVAYARVLGLDAALGDVIPYMTRQNVAPKGQRAEWVPRWSIYPTAQGYVSLAQGFPDFRGTEWRVLGQAEKETLLMGNWPLVVEVTAHRQGHASAKAIGRADPRSPKGPVEKDDPLAMAMARGTRRALRRLYSASPGAVAAILRHGADAVSLEDASRVIQRQIADAPAVEAHSTDTWMPFWERMGELGLDADRVHEIVMGDPKGSLKDFEGMPADAEALVIQWMREQDLEPASDLPSMVFEADEPTPDPDPFQAEVDDFLDRIAQSSTREALGEVAGEIRDEARFEADSDYATAVNEAYTARAAALEAEEADDVNV